MPMLADAHISSLGYLWFKMSAQANKKKWHSMFVKIFQLSAVKEMGK